MILRDIQRREVVVILLHLRPFSHAVTKTQEEIDDFFGGGDQGVAVPHRNPRWRRRHVDAFAGDAFRHRRLLNRLKPITQQGLHLGLQDIGPLAHHRALLPRQLAHRPEHTGQSPFLAEQTDAELLEGCGIGRLGDFSGGLLFQGIQLIGELLQGDRGAHGTEAEGA